MLLGAALLVLLQAGAAGGQDWQRTLEAPIIGLSDDRRGECFAVLTAGELVVFAYDGHELWRRDLTTLGRWFRAGQVAVAPACTWAAISGTPEYRYVWVIEQSGRSRHVAFGKETPTALAIAPQGDLLAVATGAERLHLFNLRTPGPLKAAAIRSAGSVILALAFTADGDRLMTAWSYAAAVFTRAGETIWSGERGYVCRTTAPVSGAWTVSACSPPHFSSAGELIARARDGAVLWRKAFDMVQAEVSGDGSAIWVKSDPDPSSEIGRTRLTVLRPDGTVRSNAEVETDADSYSLLAAAEDGACAVLRQRESVLSWHAADGSRLRREDLVDELSEIHPHRNLTRLIGVFDASLIVMARPGCASGAPVR